jgi:hypothetical protein
MVQIYDFFQTKQVFVENYISLILSADLHYMYIFTRKIKPIPVITTVWASDKSQKK